jgi:hypothetical protein
VKGERNGMGTKKAVSESVISDNAPAKKIPVAHLASTSH